jgi:hypothetical protein
MRDNTLTLTLARLDDRIERRLVPEAVFDLRWLFRCRVKILMVTDASGGFTETAGFHLGQIVKLLGEDPWSHISFSVTKAHREQSSEADVIDNFRFDGHDLSQYSQVWLFGISRTGAGTPLSQSELRALSSFMDAGGGVFATGDHEDLGNSMCGQIPRVRSMRRWHWPNPGPNGEPVAPDQSSTDPNAPGGGRHDTIVNFGAGGNQTDPDPQEIRPRLWSRTIFSGGFTTLVERYPHPVLCGPGGVINYLPDHMHEGCCEVPSDLGRSWTFDGETFVEYPSKNGHQERPEVIAYADNNVAAADFGVLGAYDGHRVDVGRVVVDATWHHWFNINTLPYINASNPSHPSYKPATAPKWAEIAAYFRNVAVWLANPSLQRCIRNGSWLRTLGDYDIQITARDLRQVHDPVLYFWQLGTFARDALGRGATQCQSLRWRIDRLVPLDLGLTLDPWTQIPQEPIDPPRGLDFDSFEAVVLGAGVHEARMKFGGIAEPERLLADDGREAEAVFMGGMKRGLEVFRDSVRASRDATEKFLSRID